MVAHVAIGAVFVVLLAGGGALLKLGLAKSIEVTRNADFTAFQTRYLQVYCCVIMADWLQGPYLYRLYEEYGFLESQIAALYMVGFASSMAFGPLFGGLADKYGRKRLCLVFCVTYSLCCLTKLSGSFFTLLLGRLLGGISTSLLFSVFESWMVSEHNRLGFPSEWLPRTFVLQTFINSAIAALAGLLANIAADCCGHHPVRPFLLAVVFLVAASGLIRALWTENMPRVRDVTTTKRVDCVGSMHELRASVKIQRLGWIQALFEAAMYIFVFLWTPVLDVPEASGQNEEHPPLGLIFAAFMLALMLGTGLFRQLLSQQWAVTRILRQALVVAVAALAITVVAPSPTISFLAFVVFEGCIGVYYPAIGVLRGEILPEEHRAGIMNWFRVPLNAIVIVFLLAVSVMPRRLLLLLCSMLCAGAYAMHQRLTKQLAEEQAQALEEAGGQQVSTALRMTKIPTASPSSSPAPVASKSTSPSSTP